MKKIICAAAGGVGGGIAYLMGGIDSTLITLFIMMIIDFLSGLAVGGVFHKSQKTESGSLSSSVGFKGICKKIMILAFVVIGHRLDIEFGSEFLRDGICIAFITNEFISILENAKLMGMNIPNILSEALDILNTKSNSKEDERNE